MFICCRCGHKLGEGIWIYDDQKAPMPPIWCPECYEFVEAKKIIEDLGEEEIDCEA